jgi:uncharacterized membrane protein YgdD (TMEM256/DUF423 family)
MAPPLHEATPRDVGLPRDALHTDVLPGDALPEDATHKNASHKDALPRDDSHQGALPRDALHKDALPKGAWYRAWLALGALAGLLAVALAAWAAHGAPARLDAQALAALGNGLQMQGWHALALLATGLWAERRGGVLPHLAGAAFALGLLLFCGGVYAGAIGGVRLGPVAPTGGMMLMAGWALLLASALKR